jgi:ABC-2 type transport system permease protein
VSGSRVVWLVLRREVREGVRGRQFLISTALLVVLLAGIVALSAFFGNQSTVRIGIGGAAPARLVATLDATAKPLGVQVELHRYADAAAARQAVAQRKVDAAFTDGGRGLLRRADSAADALAVATAAARSTFLDEQAQRAGITPRQARAVLASPLAVAVVGPAEGSSSRDHTFALVMMIVLFIAVSVYGQTVLTSTVQEKASRIVEVLLAALRPRHLLAGKVAGIALLGLSQLVLLALVAGIGGATGAIDLPPLDRTAPLAIVWFLLGFSFYAVAFAAVGALVSRAEEATAVATPISLVMVACYLGAFGAVASPDGSLATVLTLLPPAAPMVVPARAALTTIPLWQYGLSFALMLLAIWGLIRAGGRIYELGLLRTGPRVPFREALQAARRATA